MGLVLRHAFMPLPELYSRLMVKQPTLLIHTITEFAIYQ